ncbi:MAG: hypothetical protein ACF8AM_09425 [Rhodopirellula sp. JB055]|uniref:hypothetical protein n=1 Tax=Rhodopirellula sp. JB055 TaxID=3342846 RepID=UPI00370C5FB9
MSPGVARPNHPVLRAAIAMEFSRIPIQRPIADTAVSQTIHAPFHATKTVRSCCIRPRKF